MCLVGSVLSKLFDWATPYKSSLNSSSLFSKVSFCFCLCFPSNFFNFVIFLIKKSYTIHNRSSEKKLILLTAFFRNLLKIANLLLIVNINLLIIFLFFKMKIYHIYH